jgi:hypothetical protein
MISREAVRKKGTRVGVPTLRWTHFPAFAGRIAYPAAGRSRPSVGGGVEQTGVRYQPWVAPVPLSLSGEHSPVN